MMRSIVLALAMAAMPDVAAQTKVQIAEGESVLTLRIDGELLIDPEGRVQEYRISTKLDPQVEKLVAREVPAWRFKPIVLDGKPVAAKSPMRITLAATEAKGGYEVRVDNVVFRSNTKEEYEAQQAAERALHEQGRRIGVAGEPSIPEEPVNITSAKLTPPGYPKGLMMAGVEGVVLLNLRLNADGTVAEVFASQSSLLNVKGSPQLLDRARSLLEKNAAAAAAKWRFTVEARNLAALKPSDLTVRVPVDYLLSSPGSKQASLTGKWRNEFRGPSYPVPWLLDADEEPVIGVSDLDSGEFFAGASSFRLTDKSVIGKVL
jgi:TonB family protein